MRFPGVSTELLGTLMLATLEAAQACNKPQYIFITPHGHLRMGNDQDKERWGWPVLMAAFPDRDTDRRLLAPTERV